MKVATGSLTYCNQPLGSNPHVYALLVVELFFFNFNCEIIVKSLARHI